MGRETLGKPYRTLGKLREPFLWTLHDNDTVPLLDTMNNKMIYETMKTWKIGIGKGENIPVQLVQDLYIKNGNMRELVCSLKENFPSN